MKDRYTLNQGRNALIDSEADQPVRIFSPTMFMCARLQQACLRSEAQNNWQGWLTERLTSKRYRRVLS